MKLIMLRALALCLLPFAAQATITGQLQVARAPITSQAPPGTYVLLKLTGVSVFVAL